MDLAPDFDEFCGLLIEHRVDFVIVDAYALAFHGAHRATGDLDIYVKPTAENGRRLVAAIAAFGFPTDAFSAEDIVQGHRIIQMGLEPVQIHVMSDISGVSWDEVWSGRRYARCGSHDVAFIGRDQILAAVREQLPRERGKKTLNQSRALPGYQGQSP